MKKIFMLTLLLVATLFIITQQCSANDDIQVNDKVQIISEVRNGFTHPGIGLTREVLEGVRRKLIDGREPWNSHFQEFAKDRRSAKNVTPRNESRQNPGMPDADAFNSKSTEARLSGDGQIAYQQALMYFFTGDNTYRSNALHCIRVWSKMDTSKFRAYPDSNIHSSYPIYFITQAAEILRHTSTDDPKLIWTQADTDALSNNLIRPAIETFMNYNGWFMNQNNFALFGAMSGYIFMDDRVGYEKRVEWFTVNKDAPNQGFSGSIKQLARMVSQNEDTKEKIPVPRVQLTEMGRDQAHSVDDLNLFASISQIIMGQKTLVDPVNGTVSNKQNAVPVIEFLDDRILKAADYFCKFMLGHEVEWTTVAENIDENGKPIRFYRVISDNYKGRWTTFAFWPIWYYYTYEKKLDLSQVAPFFDRAFKLRINPGNWLFIPENATGESLRVVPLQIPQDEIKLATRTTLLDSNSQVVKESDNQIIRVTLNGTKSSIAMLSCATNAKMIALKVRTNGIGEITISDLPRKWIIPDTNEEWRYIFYQLQEFESIGNFHQLELSSLSNVSIDMDTLVTDAKKLINPPEINQQTLIRDIVTVNQVPIQISLTSDTENLTYHLWNAPQNMSINSKNGFIKWTPNTAGKYKFLAGIDNQKSIVLEELIIEVGTNREDAIKLAIAKYNKDTEYKKSTLLRFLVARANAESSLKNASNESFLQKLKTLRKITNELEELTPLLSDGSINFVDIVKSDVGREIFWLTDNKKVTAPVFRSGLDLNYFFDFGPNYRVATSSFAFLGPQIFDVRMADSTVFASNDAKKWDRITPDETPFTEDYFVLDVAPEFRNKQYRYLKFAKLHKKMSNIFTLSELRIFGKRFQQNDEIESVSISSDKAIHGRIQVNDRVKLTVKLAEDIQNIRVTIQGEIANITPTDFGFIAEAVMTTKNPAGNVNFTIDYQNSKKAKAPTVNWVTDESSLLLADSTNELQNFLNHVVLIDTTPGRKPSDTRRIVETLFDNNPHTASDFRSTEGGHSSGITFDFGNQVIKIARVELLAISGRYSSRITNTVLQGSQDGENWKDLTPAAKNTTEWQSFNTIRPVVAYRYYRLFNKSVWFGNMAEVRFHVEK